MSDFKWSFVIAAAPANLQAAHFLEELDELKRLEERNELIGSGLFRKIELEFGNRLAWEAERLMEERDQTLVEVINEAIGRAGPSRLSAQMLTCSIRFLYLTWARGAELETWYRTPTGYEVRERLSPYPIPLAAIMAAA